MHSVEFNRFHRIQWNSMNFMEINGFHRIQWNPMHFVEFHESPGIAWNSKNTNDNSPQPAAAGCSGLQRAAAGAC